ncbi:MAG: 3-deoxy-8-phosphooctulonate synthase [Chloroflexi bacterium HGW-Chloroflexi-2]|jgi:2-dehydro-3-deoxyphosphooctonate aldolase (KDO 8-P synthase)|nr:MAG: 3-deoxy-8-phosphooctulonate synthase [Chloroflexi bacterium HGW-Chloroflexi-2]
MSEYKKIETVELAPGIILGGEKPVLIAGPCVVESEKITIKTAEKLKEITQRLDIPFVFKSSYDKANRTSGTTFRSIGFEEALKLLQRVRKEFDVPVLTDVHESNQVESVAQVVDVLQIPAFLCRQTDLLFAAGKTGKAVNIKKGQFMAPEDMRYSLDKVRRTGNEKVCLTERGTSFGYHTLVVDFRSLPIMRQFAPVIFDATHSVQMPGGAGGASSGQREFVAPLARAAAAVGVDGFFIETHPDPDHAPSDGANMVKIDELEKILVKLLDIINI